MYIVQCGGFALFSTKISLYGMVLIQTRESKPNTLLAQFVMVFQQSSVRSLKNINCHVNDGSDDNCRSSGVIQDIRTHIFVIVFINICLHLLLCLSICVDICY